MPRAIVMKAGDNVATVLEPVPAGTLVEIEGLVAAIIPVADPIPFGHKFAITDIAKGETIRKYGEAIGLATADIRAGSHVHVHNLESTRGRGDK